MTRKINEQAGTMTVNEIVEVGLEDILTPEQLETQFMADCEARAAELAKKHNVLQVHVYVGIDENGGKVIGYIKEPSYIQKLVAMDKISTIGPFMAGDELREVLTLKEESDPRTYLTSPDCDKYRLGMTGKCVTIIEVAANTFKKK